MTLEEFKNRLSNNNVDIEKMACGRYDLSTEQIVIAFEETGKGKLASSLLEKINYLIWQSYPHGILWFSPSQTERLQKVIRVGEIKDATDYINKVISRKTSRKKWSINIEKIVPVIQNDDLMLSLANYIVEMNDVDKIIAFVKECAEYSARFVANDCANIPGKALEVLTPLVVATKDVSKMLYYAENISYTFSIVVWESLTDAIILTNDLNIIYGFAEKYPRANKEKLARTFIDSKSLKLVYKFAKNIGEIPENVMNQLVTFVSQTNLPEFMYLFASKISMSDDNLILLGHAIKGTENTELISYFLLVLGNSKSEKLNSIKHDLRMYLEKYGNNDWMFKYDCNLADKLETTLLESNDEKENPFLFDESDKMKRLI